MCIAICAEMKGTTQEQIKAAFDRFVSSTKVSCRKYICIYPACITMCVCVLFDRVVVRSYWSREESGVCSFRRESQKGYVCVCGCA